MISLDPFEARILRFAVCLSLMAPLSAESLREVLVERQVAPGSLPSRDLERPITSYAVYQESGRFLLAYYEDTGRNRLPDELHILRLLSPSGAWEHQVLPLVNLDPHRPGLRPGAITAIASSPRYLYLRGHLNPSSAATLVLSQELEFRDLVYGWVVGLLDGNRVVYQHSQVHFAPTHFVELSLYDPETGKHRQIYPLKPYSEVRKQHIERVKAAYLRRGEAWFRNHNHHMNPELFDSHLRGQVVVDRLRGALAFVIAYDHAVPAGGQPSGASRFQEVICIYPELSMDGPLRFQELLLSDFQARFRGATLQEALHWSVLETLFR